MSESKTITKPAPREIAEALERQLPAQQVVKAIADALAATAVTKSGVSVIDHRTRLAAAELALRYTVGLPVQRTEAISVNLDADSGIGLDERLAHSPALRAQLAAALARAERKSATSI